MTTNEMQAMISKLQAENEALRKSKQSRLTLKIGAKGGLSLYGLGRFPITLYREQWERVLGMADEIKAFIKANEKDLTLKADKPVEAASAPVDTGANPAVLAALKMLAQAKAA